MFNVLGRWVTIPIHNRSLFWGFVNQEIRGRYAGSIGGMLWSLITPFLNLIIYIFVFSVIFQVRLKPIETGTENFVLFLLAGLLPWMAFSESVVNSTSLFLGKANLITKVAFPLEVLPISALFVTYFLNGIGFAIYLIYLASQGMFHASWYLLPLVVALQMIFSLGLMILIGSLSVFLRDIQQFIGTIVSLWMYLSPILYPISMVPEYLRKFMVLNPVYFFIEMYHRILLQHMLPWRMLMACAVVAVSSFLAGAYFFSKSRRAFADVM